jgi:hypothetical protein
VPKGGPVFEFRLGCFERSDVGRIATFSLCDSCPSRVYDRMKANRITYPPSRDIWKILKRGFFLEDLNHLYFVVNPSQIIIPYEGT